MGSNPMRWVLTGGLVVAAVAVIANLMGGDPPVPDTAPPADTAAAPPGTAAGAGTPGDGDTVAETLSTVSAQYREIVKRMGTSDAQRAEQQRVIEDLRQQLAARPAAGDDTRAAGAEAAEEAGAIAQLREQVTRLEDKLRQATGQITDGFGEAATQIDGPYQIGLGLGGGQPPGTADPTDLTAPVGGVGVLPGYVALRPLTRATVGAAVGAAGPGEPAATAAPGEPGQDAGTGLLDGVFDAPARPVATIPARATLLRARAMTALIGRVPVGGQVTDPFPVKVIIGAENLAANGHRVDGITGMVFDGTATGDWTLSCVSVRLTGATFVFADGTVRHVPSTAQAVRDGVEQGVGAGFGTDSDTTIGYLSDRFGTPCLPGKRLTDAHKQAALFSLFGLAQGRLDAKAAAETSALRDNAGTATTVTGDAGVFATYSQYANATREFIDLYRERFADTFDAIYVGNGAEVVVNVTRDLHIDYQPGARRLHYAQDTHDAHDLD